MSVSRRTLLVTPVSPFECASGTQQRTHLLHRALRSRSNVDVVIVETGSRVSAARSDAGRTVRATAIERQDLRRFAPSASLTDAVEGALGRNLSDYDLVVGRYLWAVTQLALPRGVPIVADLDDFHYRYGRAIPLSLDVIMERTRKTLSHQLARRQLGRLRAAFFASALDQAEAGIDNRLLPNVPLHIVANPDFDVAGARILFVGSLWYRPNRDGIDWFLRAVWPDIARAYPNATLRLVGAAAPEVRAQWTRHPRVEAPGFVDDLAAEYAAATLVVAPIHSGGGSNIKILEALAHGRACVTTRFCLAAFEDLARDRDLAAADTARDFTDACTHVLANSAQRSALARSGHAQVKQHYTIARFEAVVHDMLDAVWKNAAAEATPWPA